MVYQRLPFCSGVVWAKLDLYRGILENVIAFVNILNAPLSDLDLLGNACPLGSTFVLTQQLIMRSVLAIECDLNS